MVILLLSVASVGLSFYGALYATRQQTKAQAAIAPAAVAPGVRTNHPKLASRTANFYPGQIKSVSKTGNATGGPANAGAKPIQGQKIIAGITQPSWHYESIHEDVGKYNYATNKGITAGNKRDNFRELGDLHGGRA
jgi:hypothetical protein